MQWHQKVTSFAILEGGWLTWIVMGFVLGGSVLMIQRAVGLIATWAADRKDRARLRGRDAGPGRGVQPVAPGTAPC